MEEGHGSEHRPFVREKQLRGALAALLFAQGRLLVYRVQAIYGQMDSLGKACRMS
jgi:hypothetical protein